MIRPWNGTKMQTFKPDGKINCTPLVLAVETSGRAGSVAIAQAGEVLAQTHFSGPMRHSKEIFPAIKAMLQTLRRKPQQIAHIYISAGPGSFTGLRIAVTMAKTLNLATKAKIVAVDTMDVIAANAIEYIEKKQQNINRIGTILDAKRGQFFAAVYENQLGKWEKSLPDCLITAEKLVEKFADSNDHLWLLGEGLLYYKDKFDADGIEFFDESLWNPQAAKVHQLGWKKARSGIFADAGTLIPAYLRKPDAKIPQK